MAKLKKQSAKPVGASPGTVTYIGPARDTPVTISRIRYSADSYEQPQKIELNECIPESRASGVTWYTIDGVHNVEILRTIGEKFNLHPLVVEDLANTSQRPKLEEFDGYLFIAMKMVTYDRAKSAIMAEHISIVFGNGYVLLFLEDEGDLFEPIRQRIHTGKGRIRRLGADYLSYALIDMVVDCYFQVLEQIGEVIEQVEEQVIDSPRPSTLKAVHRLKRKLISLRRAVWPMREIVNELIRDESDLVSAETRLFLRDLYDHTIHTIDTIETMRDIVSGMLDVYLSSLSNKLNQVMKVLTVISSIFIPLTFIVGIYGMNFEYMPELAWRWGYPAVMVAMLIVASLFMLLFKRKGWI